MKTYHTFQSLETDRHLLNEYRDCGVKAMAVCCQVDYKTAHAYLAKAGRLKRKGTFLPMYHRVAGYLNKALIRTKKFESKTIRTLERELDDKNYLVRVGGMTNGHVVGVANGQIVDWSRGKCLRIREVYEVLDLDWWERNKKFAHEHVIDRWEKTRLYYPEPKNEQS